MKFCGALCGVAALLLACSIPEPVDDAALKDPALLPARQLYRMNCLACHGKDGRGREQLFPPLAGSEWVLGPPELSIRIVLHGLDGPITVTGRRFMNRMAPLGTRFSDLDLALLLTYVRASWGNDAGRVTPEQVAEVRQRTSGRQKPWTPEELSGFRNALDSPP